MLDEKDLARLMHAEAESTETNSGLLDLDRAMRTGRRQRWYGRGAGAALLVAALAAGVATVPSLIPTTASEPVAAGFAVPMTVPHLPVLPKAQDIIDPQVSYLKFGWVPDDYSERQYQAGLMQNGPAAYLSAGLPGGPNPDGWRGVAVTLYPRGVTPPAPQRDSGERARVAIVTPTSADGQDAVWTTYRGATLREAFLRWRYASEGWVEVRVTDLDGDVAETALRVAENLRLSSTDRVTLPLAVTGLPTALRPILVNVNDTPSGSPIWNATVNFSAAPAAVDPARQHGTELAFTVWPYHHEDTRKVGPQDKQYPKPNTTIDEHPARRWPLSGPVSDLTIYNVNGVNIDVHANDPEVLRQLGPEGCLAAYRNMRLVDRPAEWATALNQ